MQELIQAIDKLTDAAYIIAAMLFVIAVLGFAIIYVTSGK